MKIIVGLGNDAPQYDGTRHNAGLAALDYYAAQNNAAFGRKPKFFAAIAELPAGDSKALLVKPATYYNETGRAVRALVDFYQLSTDDVVVIHDELALPFGTIRTRRKGSDAGNNGVKSINEHIGSDYARIRVGIYSAVREQVDDADFVLARFSKDEQQQLPEIFNKICALIDSFILDKFIITSHSQ